MSANDPVVPGLATARQRERAESLLVTAYRSGITDADMVQISQHTRHVSGLPVASGEVGGDPGPLSISG